MVYRYKRRRVAKKGKVAHLRPAMRKAVAKLVRGKVEVKRQYYSLADTDLYASRVYAMDVTQYITQGTGEVQRVGDTISDVYFRMANMFSWEGLQSGTTRVWQGGKVRLMLVKTPIPITGVSINVLTDVTGQVNNVFLNTWQTTTSLINTTSPIKVLAQTWISSYQSTDVSGNFGVIGTGGLHHKIGKLRYIDGTGDQLTRNYQYYIFATTSAPTAGSSDLLGKLQTNALISFRDA